MLTAATIAPYRTAGDDYAETEAIKQEIARLRFERRPFFLAQAEFERITRWKLRGQYGRQEHNLAVNTDALIRTVTRAAFEATHDDRHYELQVRVAILSSLRGVGVPVASALLALVLPEDYCVIDFRGWRATYGELKRSFVAADYAKYLAAVRLLASDLSWPVQEADAAIWAYDVATNG